MRRLLALCSLPVAVAVAGCSVGAKVTPGDTSLVVTRDFGARPIVQDEHPRVTSSDSVLQMLRRNARVVVDAAGSVRGVDSLSGVWKFYVNGVAPDDKPADADLAAGDDVWWDRPTPGAIAEPGAVVGSYPEPFRHGPDGKRLPVRIECSPVDSRACGDVEKRLIGDGVLAARGGVAQSFTKHTLRILVGPYVQLRGDHAVQQLEQGPQASGVFAKPSPDGRSLALLDARGAVTQTLGPGTGLVAATRFDTDQPVWVVTGTDAAGVDAAVQALDQGNLLNRFAVAVTGGRAVPLPDR